MLGFLSQQSHSKQEGLYSWPKMSAAMKSNYSTSVIQLYFQIWNKKGFGESISVESILMSCLTAA